MELRSMKSEQSFVNNAPENNQHSNRLARYKFHNWGSELKLWKNYYFYVNKRENIHSKFKWGKLFWKLLLEIGAKSILNDKLFNHEFGICLLCFGMEWKNWNGNIKHQRKSELSFNWKVSEKDVVDEGKGKRKKTHRFEIRDWDWDWDDEWNSEKAYA